MRVLAVGLFGISLFCSSAAAEECNHQQNIAFFEEGVLQAERCRVEMQVYREARQECATFFSIQARGEEMMKCYADEVASAEATGDYTTVNALAPSYTKALNELYAAALRVNAAADMLPKQ